MPDPLAGLPPRYLRTPEAARFLGLSGRTLEKHRTYGTGPTYRKIGGRVVYAIVDLQAWADQGAKSSTSDPGVGEVRPAKRHAAVSPAYAGHYGPRDSILAGAAYLREMHDRYGTVEGMLAAYNAGPERYDDYLSTGRPLPGETQAYVAAIAPNVGGTVPPTSPKARAAQAIDLFAAPIFVPRAADRGEPTAQAVVPLTAAFTADEARSTATQSTVFTSPGMSSERQMAADRAVTAAQPERTTNATELRPAPESGSLFVSRSQSEFRP